MAVNEPTALELHQEEAIRPKTFENTSPENTSTEDGQSQARDLLTPEEERKLLRRIDWHLMPLCSIIFMFKNLDSDNVSNNDETDG